MKQILWFRRDLRIKDNAILAHAKGEVLPIFIFDTNILNKLPSNDKRVTFIYQSVLNLKKELQSLGLNLAIFYGDPETVFQNLKVEGFTSVLCSVDNDHYAKKRDKNIASIMPLERFSDSFLIDSKEVLNKSNLPYKVFTPFYNALHYLWEANKITEFTTNQNLSLVEFNHRHIPTLEEMGFTEQPLPNFLMQDPHQLLKIFSERLANYTHYRDFIAINGTSEISVHLRFGLISPKEIFNAMRPYSESKPYIRQLFFREFYNYLLYHFPKSQFENHKPIEVEWNNNKEHFKKWCEGKTGVPIVDAAMQHLNKAGLMHNRLRMIVASYLTKNLLIDWRWGETYFAEKLLDYEASSNVASWQWAASTGSDAVPYFRVFNPYLQSEKFDKEGLFIKSVLPQLKEIDAKLLHKENGVQSNLFLNYPQQIISIKISRDRVSETFKKAHYENV
ncbi:MAG: Deoxyribodipyrimidine photolyase (EC [uncultured Sulfurovum sp.]|uniref:Deoxyribodipyrimidine photolyase (EC) n=1 Tax=uncultured Sulfurovum sp. TaxID=269237 RepID=A0A6S6SDT7_9BACT|nr:MAG: Deoxyribodipyrimidine photolyase (EC [uncultured Sulfurovum sp.]